MPFKPAETIPIIAGRIAASPAPILMLDTCSAIDVIRAGTRRDLRPELVRSATEIIQRTRSNPRRLWLLVTDLVLAEWTKNSPGEKDSVVQNILKLNREIASFRVTAQHAVPLGTR
jgi:hypothetical protein